MRHTLRRFLALAILASAVLASPGARADTKPGRYHKDYRNGYAIQIPKDWDRVPPKTEESEEVGKWYGRRLGWVTPEMQVVRLDLHKAAATESGDADEDEIPIPEEIRRRFRFAEKPESVKQWFENRLERYFGDTAMGEEKPYKIGGEEGSIQYATVTRGEMQLQLLFGSVRKGDIEYGILFEAEKDEFERSHERGFLYCIKSFKFLEVKSEKDIDYEAAFDAENLPKDEAEQQRWLAKIKSSIDNVKEWDYLTTANYLILYDNSVKPRDVKEVAVKIEAIRRDVYEMLFPPEKPIKAISVVRVCKDRRQYNSYGGPGSSAGYWSPGAKELVFFFEDKDAIRVLYHEAFHQYIFYAFGSVSPAIWFNEGHGDYFAGFNYKGRFVPGKFQWRQGVIKNAIATDTTVPLADFLKYTQQQYYANASLCYAQGWSLVYFLRHTKNKEYQKILPTYFDTLKRELGAEPADDDGAIPDGFQNMGKAQQALDKALEEAFRGIDLDRLESEWKAFRF